MAEITVVLVILAIGCTFALTAYSAHSRKLAIQTSSNSIRTAIGYAKQYAISTGRPASLKIDLKNQLYWIDEVTASGVVTKKKIVPPEQPEVGVVISGMQVGSQTDWAFTAQVAEATFLPDGSNPLVKVALRREAVDGSATSNSFLVQLLPASSEVRVVPGGQL